MDGSQSIRKAFNRFNMPRVKLFNEQEVLEKAMNLFWKQGYFATSVQDLVNHLGINRASLYDTFGGKKELFDRAFAHYRSSNAQIVRQFLHQQSDIRAGLKALYTMAIDQSRTDNDRKGCFVVNSTIEFIPNDQEMGAVIESNREQFIQIFQDYLLQGIKSGQISKEKDIQAIATLLFTFYNGLRVVTKTNFDQGQSLASVEALLLVLD